MPQDFRSEDGLYSLINVKHNHRIGKGSAPKAKGHIKGKDLFDANLWKSADSTSVFYTFIASLRRKIQEEIKSTSATHKFIRRVRDQGKLVRCYTQNIDGLEAHEGLCQDLARGKGSRSRFTKGALSLPNRTQQNIPGGKVDGGCEVVQLHGDIATLRCTICRYEGAWNTLQKADLLRGRAPKCPSCSSQDHDRRGRGKRGSQIGTLRPNIVLYGEGNPAAESISSLVQNDLQLGPDLLLIFGTSLKVHGLKSLVKEFAKAVHSKKNGRVIFVNLTAPAESIWKGIIDYWIDIKCDDWTYNKFTERQSQIPFKTTKNVKAVIQKKASTSEDKENIEEIRVRNGNSKADTAKVSPRKQPLVDFLPTPAPSRRRGLGDATPRTNCVEPAIDSSPCKRQAVKMSPTKRAFMKNFDRSSNNNTTIASTPSSKQPMGLITPRSTFESPRKRRKSSQPFEIWDSDDGPPTDEEAQVDDPVLENLKSPSARGRKRKLAYG